MTLGEDVIEGFMRTRRLLDEALVYADTATRLGDVAAVDPELARMTRAQLLAFVSPVLAHRGVRQRFLRRSCLVRAASTRALSMTRRAAGSNGCTRKWARTTPRWRWRVPELS